MAKRLILGFSASLLFMTAVAAAPVRAQSNEQIGRTIAGAVTLFILGNALADTINKNDNKKNSKASGSKAGKGTISNSDNRYQGNVSHGQYQPWNAPGKGRNGVHPLKVVPMQCFFTINQRHREVGVFGEQCLRNTVKKAEWLPRECRTAIPVRHGRDAIVYNAQCLREFGWRTSGYRTAGGYRGDDHHEDDRWGDDRRGGGRRH